MKWALLDIPKDDTQGWRDAVRLNSLGSLFFFANFVLKKARLAALHWHMCSVLESADLHLVFEIPMSHFKTSIGVEALSMWWALPFTNRDEDLMRALGYGDEWIRWMREAHDQNARTLITHQTFDRVVEMGKAIDAHYSSNDVFRFVFDDLFPIGDTWNNRSKFHRRTSGADMSTGTFVMRSVGQALQGIHATGIINDDSVGREAQKNLLEGDGGIMDGVYRWWQQTTTRFDPIAFTRSGIGRQLVIGNRWAHQDLNYWIRRNHPEFHFETHDAEGGCPSPCTLHPVHGVPIFPEEWTMERLNKQKETLEHEGKGYDYIHFYRNKTSLPEDALFKPAWIRKYICAESAPEFGPHDLRNFLLLRHIVKDGEPIPDLNAGVLHKRLIVVLADPKRRRPNHVVLVAGYEPERDWIYLLKLEVGKFMHGDLLDKIYKLAGQMGLEEFYTSSQTAEALKFYIDERNRRDKTRALRVFELQCDDGDAAQTLRVESLQALFRGKQFWCHPSFKEFFAEYESFPGGPVEVLNAVGMVPSTLEGIRRKDLQDWYAKQYEAFANRSAGAGGYG